MDVTLGRGWTCQNCSLENSKNETYCKVCLFARPMDTQGVPKIFSGYFIHFNGIIPRTLKHPSHSVEWRMAERHGAVCLAKFDPKVVNLLIYRVGYERSDKCRMCVDRHTNIAAVPITWMLDSLLQSRQIHPSLYRLTAIPAVANPTVKGTELPHHQHPFYIINKDDYAIPTSFPANKAKKAAAGANATPGIRYDVDIPAGINVPPFFEVGDLIYETVDVYDAAVQCGEGKNKNDDEDNDEQEARKTTAGIDLLAAQQASNRVDKVLFSGLNIALSPTLERDPNVRKAIEMCGAKVVDVSGNAEEVLRNDTTHVIYAHEDKKCDLMISAAHLVSTDLPGLQLIQSNWLEDCLMEGELIPAFGMYVPTAKLMETLNKKYSKKN